MARGIRMATLADAAAIQAIYAPVVRASPSSFEYTPPTVAEMAARMAKILSALPWLVMEDAGQVIGYAYAGPHGERAAYQWAVDVSVYVHADHHRQGVGRALYCALFRVLRAQGYVNVYAGVTLPNPGSVGLHEAMGMTPVGVYRLVGYKFGAWHDVGWWQGTLQARPAAPQTPIPVSELSDSEYERAGDSLS
jgi:phosphinothricin acetyltransferase